MAKLQAFLRRPRYLRAIPSLMVLTTAMAWSMAPDADGLDATGKKAGFTLVRHTGSTAGNGWADEPPALKR